MNTIFLTANCKLNRIIFWEPCISPHKADFFAAVSAILPNVEIIYCADQDLPAERRALGWNVNCAELVKTVVSPNTTLIESLVFENCEQTLHIFSGTRHLPTLVLGLKAVKLCGARFAIMAEPRVFEGWQGIGRFLQSWLTEGWLRRNCEFVLAIGRNGPHWFKSVGYDAKKTFPFAYFVLPHNLTPVLLNTDTDLLVRIGYVGRLIKMKGIFDLAEAVRQLGKPVHLTIVGAGSDENNLRKMCLEYDLSVDFKGVLPNQLIGEILQKLDVLVLASTSKDDGWGVVVSEALMCGTAVVATHCVGASIMLEEPLFGNTISPNKPDEISHAIERLEVNGAFLNQNRLARQELAKAKLSPDAGARYFIEILNYRFGGGSVPLPFYSTQSNVAG